MDPTLLLPPIVNHSTHPSHTPSHPSHTPTHHSGPAPLPSSQTPSFPPDDNADLLSDDLGALYSAIDDIFDATIRSTAELATGLDVKTTTPKSSPKERRKDFSNARTESADAAKVTPAPKPFPRTRSQTELKPSTSESSKEVNSHGNGHGNGHGGTRVMGFEELSNNYSKLQLEVQELRKELAISRELEGE